MPDINQGRKRTLTEHIVQQARTGDLKPATYPARDGSGLALVVRKQDAAWYLLVKVSGRQISRKLGRVQTMTFSQARDRALTLRMRLKTKNTPTGRSRDQKAEGVPFSDAIEAWIDAGCPSKGKRFGHANHKTADYYRRLFRNVMPARTGQNDIAYVDGQDLDPIHRPQRENPIKANRVRSALVRTLDYARSQGWRSGRNPARDLPAYDERTGVKSMSDTPSTVSDTPVSGRTGDLLTDGIIRSVT